MKREIPPIEEVLDMIRFHANRCVSMQPRGGIWDADELIAEGRLVYVVCARKFDPERNVKFTTVLYRYLAGRFGNILKSRIRRSKHEQAVPVDNDGEPDMEGLIDKGRADYRRVIDLMYTPLTRLEHLTARALLEDPKMKKRLLWAKLGVTPNVGRAIMHSLQVKLSEASSVV